MGFQDLVTKHPHKLAAAMIVISIIFIMIGHIWHEEIQAKLKQPIVHVNAFDIDWWSISHFMLFGFLGFIYPNRHMSFLGLGVAWEVFEDMLSNDSQTQLWDCKRVGRRGLVGKLMCRGYEDAYWYGKIDDIAMNLLGFTLGSAIRTTLVKW